MMVLPSSDATGVYVELLAPEMSESLVPSLASQFLRSFRWGHVRQLDRVSRQLLARAWAAGAGPGVTSRQVV